MGGTLRRRVRSGKHPATLARQRAPKTHPSVVVWFTAPRSGAGPARRRLVDVSDLPPRRARDDRHGRHRRAEVDPRRRPSDGYRTRDRGRFARLVTDAIAQLPEAILDHLDACDVLVLDAPPVGTDDAPPALAVVHRRRRRPQLLVHRRPLELRATGKADLVDLIAEVLVEALAEHHGWSDGDVDDLGWPPPGGPDEG